MEQGLNKVSLFNKLSYAPFPQQKLFHDSRTRFRVPVCGRRFGKSLMTGRDLEPKLFLSKKTFWIVGPTYDLGEKEFRVVWNDLIIGMGLGKDKRIKKAYNKKQGNMYIEFPWQTRLEVRSAEHPENLVGDALDGVVMSEAAKHKQETWERYIRPALTDRKGWADFPTTPEGYNWLHDLWQLGRNPDYLNYESWSFPSWANTEIYPGGRDDPEIVELERTTTPEYFMQEIGADFASFVGKIFPEWDEHTHVQNVQFRPDLPNYVAFDWGYTNPLAAIEFQITPMDEIRIWRVHYKALTRLEDHLNLMKKREQPPGYRVDMCFGDAADPEATATVNRYFAPCVSDPRCKSEFTWREGIDLIRGFMKPLPSLHGSEEIDEYGTPAPDRPRFLVDHSCPEVIGELNNYRSKAPVKGQNVPEWGAKMDDHSIDALRYGLIHIFKLGATNHLSETQPVGRSWEIPQLSVGAPVTLDSGTELDGMGFGSITSLEF